MLVLRGIRVVPYCLWTNEEKKQQKAKQGEHEIISIQALFICLLYNLGVYACAILFPTDSNKKG